MNQAGIWLVVKPTVGLPLLLGGVAITSLIVHAAVLTHTTWYPNFMNGSRSRGAAMNGSVNPVALATGTAPPAFVVSITPAPAQSGTAFVVTVTPNPAASPTALATTNDEPPQAPPKVALAGTN